ncbi:HIG1 domain family member 1C-like [Amphibalanus amphitrite]|uniref:HIG1 domain family member 1C-like n=1 Tax=Amphibalanus amphitrite TaxID=1232801 RepID=UPI001C903980|nr:HIG1 domain family member 1C-like [Amphibalanus amphitrite]
MSSERVIPSESFDSEASSESKLARKIKESPFMVAGLVGLTGIVGYNLYNLRRRPKDMKMSVYLIHMRVAAQGFVVSCLTAGVCYQMYKDHLKPKLAEWQQTGN